MFLFFHQSQNQTRYSIVKEASNLIDWRIRRLIDLEGWLKATVGVSLNNFILDISIEYDFYVRSDFDAKGRPPENPLKVEVPYTGSLLGLLNIKYNEWDGRENFPPSDIYDYSGNQFKLEVFKS